jgi:acyl carrier protein
MTVAIEQQIRDYIQQNFLFGNPVEFGNQDSFLELGIVDSTGVLELVTFVQETFNLEIKDEEIVPENLDSIQNLAEFVRRKLKADTAGETEESPDLNGIPASTI